jgi:formiminotetrahydrofolate cyclodeaminase
MVEMVEKSLTTFLEEVAARTSAPGGGAVSAVAVGMAAALVAMAARFSDKQLQEAHDLAEKADVVRAEVLPLARADAEAYAALMAAYRLPKDDPGRSEAITAAAEAAADVPLEISAFAAETALLAARLAEDGNPNLRGDAVAAALLAAAAARTAANLVRINLDETAEQYTKAAEHAAGAEAAAERALGAR